MQRTDDSALRIVVVDYQRCAFAPENLNDEHFLSPKLLAFLAANQYNFFVGHTFRCLVNIDHFRTEMLNYVPVSEQAKFTRNFPTQEITGHLADRTKIDCLTVSTLDDLVTGEVGVGYADLIDYEKSGVITPDKHVEPDELFNLMQQNNRQLLLIAQHIAKTFPAQIIQLDIIDDDLRHCNDALSIDQQADWPSNVKLNKIYRFSTRIMNDEVTEIKTTSPRQSHHRPNEATVLTPRRRIDADTNHAAAILVEGTYGTFKRLTHTNGAMVAETVTRPEPRRSARLAGKGRLHY